MYECMCIYIYIYVRHIYMYIYLHTHVHVNPKERLQGEPGRKVVKLIEFITLL